MGKSILRFLVTLFLQLPVIHLVVIGIDSYGVTNWAEQFLIYVVVMCTYDFAARLKEEES